MNLLKLMCGGGDNLLLRVARGSKRLVRNCLLVMVSVVVLNMTSCQKLDDINDRLDMVEIAVKDLQSATKSLQDAFSQAKIIQAFSATNNTPAGGWIVTFTDGSKMSIENGIVVSILEDKETGVVTINLKDGHSVWFNTQSVTPTGIVLLDTKTVELSYGTSDTLEFRVNPSNATFVMSGDNAQIVLDEISSTRASYVAKTDKFSIVNVEQVTDPEGNVKVGQYRAIIEDTKKYAEYDVVSALVLNVKDAGGHDVQISSSVFSVKSKNYENLPKTGLPIVVINTPDSKDITSKVNWMEGATMSIINADMSYEYQGSLSIKGRGNWTWAMPKKPYAIKLDKKEKIFGMPKHKRWVLLANYRDISLLKNTVAFKLSEYTSGLDWAPHGSYVELVLNGAHMGNYYLCEQIKVDDNRVNIEELDLTATSGPRITGGYLFEIDTRYDEHIKFRSTHNFPWQFKDPDEGINSVQFDYVKNYVNSMEETIFNEDLVKIGAFQEYIDLPSFAAYWIMIELTECGDLAIGNSVYMNKDKEGKMKAGPVWDFDSLTFGAISYGKQYKIRYLSLDPNFPFMHHFYYLFENKQFRDEVKNQWNILYPKIKNELPSHIDMLADQIKESASINQSIWKYDGKHDGIYKGHTFEESVDIMKRYIQDKSEFMNTYLNDLD